MLRLRLSSNSQVWHVEHVTTCPTQQYHGIPWLWKMFQELQKKWWSEFVPTCSNQIVHPKQKLGPFKWVSDQSRSFDGWREIFGLLRPRRGCGRDCVSSWNKMLTSYGPRSMLTTIWHWKILRVSIYSKINQMQNNIFSAAVKDNVSRRLVCGVWSKLALMVLYDLDVFICFALHGKHMWHVVQNTVVEISHHFPLLVNRRQF